MATNVQQIIQRARTRTEAREAASPKPERDLNRVYRAQKAALTRAIRSDDPERVIRTCRDAVNAWAKPPFNGAWPDNWSRWQRALDDALGVFNRIQLEDLTD